MTKLYLDEEANNHDVNEHPRLSGHKQAVISLSGGMDSSTVLLRLLTEGYQVTAISFDYGQKHSVELERASELIEYLDKAGYPVKYQRITLQGLVSLLSSNLVKGGEEVPEGHYEEENMKDTVVPNRNAIFASILYGYALSIALKEDQEVKIALGVHSGDHAIYPDCRPEFYEALENAFQVGNWDSEKVSFSLPYIDGDKETILRDSEQSLNKLQLDFDTVFSNTNTSYNPDEQGRSSGTSGADVERILAFHAIGKVDPVTYVKPWPEVLEDAINTENKHKEKI